MSRIKIDIPENKIASLSIPVRIADINYGGHVGNAALVTIIHEARMKWLTTYGYSELDIEGTGLIMSDLAIEFKNESFYPDNIEIVISVDQITKAGFELYYQLYTQRYDDGPVLLANAKTAMLCFDHDNKKIMSIPEALQRILQ